MAEQVVEVRRYGCYKFGCIIAIIVLIITIGAIVVQILTPYDQEVLAFFGILLLILAIASFLFIDFQRRKASKRKEESASRWIQNTIDETRSTKTLDSTLVKTWKFDRVSNTNERVSNIENSDDETKR